MSRNKNYVTSPGSILPNNTIFEMVKMGTGIQYAIKTEKGIEIKPNLNLGAALSYEPLTTCPWELPPPPIDYGSEEELWDEIRDYVYQHLDIKKPDLYHVMTGWIHMTWVPERFSSVPYLHFTGARNTGKSKALDVLYQLGYRAMLSPSISGSALFRAMHELRPTFLLDEFEMYEKQAENKAEVIGILNAGYREGQVVLRTKSSDKGFNLESFKVFGPKALSSIKKLPEALSSRCIIFPMVRMFRQINLQIDKEWAYQLRGKMLMYRFNHRFTPSPSEQQIHIKHGRIIELYTPLRILAPRQSEKDAMQRTAEEQYDRERQDDLEGAQGKIFNIILDYLEECIDEGIAIESIEYETLRERYNADIVEKYRLGTKKFSGDVLSPLNYPTQTNKRRRKEIIIVCEELRRGVDDYIFIDEQPRYFDILKRVEEGQVREKQTTLTGLASSTSITSITHRVSGVPPIDVSTPNTVQEPSNSIIMSDIVDIVDMSVMNVVDDDMNTDDKPSSIMPKSRGHSAMKCSKCGKSVEKPHIHRRTYYCKECYLEII